MKILSDEERQLYQAQIEVARKLNDTELDRHANVSFNNNCNCYNCFCCACLQVRRERSSANRKRTP
jgi:hypothetical protein